MRGNKEREIREGKERTLIRNKGVGGEFRVGKVGK